MSSYVVITHNAQAFITGPTCFYSSALRAGGLLSSGSGWAAAGGWAAGRAAARLAESISM